MNDRFPLTPAPDRDDDAGSATVNLHAVVERSVANGPGERTVIWFQGCPLACPGCANPDTHPSSARLVVPVRQLVRRIVDNRAASEGISITGGEPFAQASALRALLAGVRRESDLSVLVFTGYTLREVGRLPGAADCLPCIDVLIAGRYVAGRRVARGLLGSSNQRICLLTERYTRKEIERVPVAEVSIDRAGTVLLSGIDAPVATEQPAAPRAGIEPSALDDLTLHAPTSRSW